MRQLQIWGLALALLAGGPALALDKPQYTVVAENASFELRQYEPYVVAATSVRGSFEEAGNEGFRRLLRYISGHNQASGKIAMTAPVGQRPGQKIPMTAPVNQRAQDGDWLVTFMMPSSLSAADLPAPLDARVSIQPIRGRLIAALRYSGRWSEARYRRHEQRLAKALDNAGLVIDGEPELARYDPPFMPWPFRRNEVLIPVVPNERAARR